MPDMSFSWHGAPRGDRRLCFPEDGIQAAVPGPASGLRAQFAGTGDERQ
jgi:hypothetical protein